MSNNVADMWPWKLIGSARREISSCPKSPVWMPKRSSAGRKELERELAERPVDRVRLPGGGRPRAEKKDAELETTLAGLVLPETAGDPNSRAEMGAQ